PAAAHAGLAHERAAQRLDDGGLTGEPGVEVRAAAFAATAAVDRLDLEDRGVPEQLGVDVDVLEGLADDGAGVVDDGGVGGDPRADGGDELLAVGAAGADEPGELDAGRQGDVLDVAGLGDLDEGPGPPARGQVLEDRADRGGGGLVTGEQELGRGAGRPVGADRVVPGAGVRPDEDDAVPRAGGPEPARGGAGVAVDDHVDVDLGPLGPDGAHGVRAEGAAPVLGGLTPPLVPGAGEDGLLVLLADVGEVAVLEGQEELDPLVVPVGAEPPQVRPGEGDPAEARAQGTDGSDLDGVGPVRGTPVPGDVVRGDRRRALR